MNKELTPLEANVKLYQMIGSAGNGGGFDLVVAWKYKTIIETALKDYEKKTKLAKEYADVNNVGKRLKALEIIKEKMVNVCAFISWNNIVDFTYERYLEIQLTHLVSAKRLTREEFDLLKEVLL